MKRISNSPILRIFVASLCATLLVGATSHEENARVGNFEERLLAVHNSERAKLGLLPLDWNADLAKGAEKWAAYLASTSRFEHSPTAPGIDPEGENIWGGTASAFTIENMVELWIAEKKYFQTGAFPNNSITGDPSDVSHYTQIIWHDTREVGCGLSRSNGEEVLVCRYTRPGNILGEKPY